VTESPRSVARLRLGSSRDIDQLKDLWLELHAHHAEIMPGLAPYQAAEDSWATRREHYEDLLGRPGTDLVLCTLDTKLVGYGLSHVRPAADTWLADTWVTGTRVGEIESLLVRSQHRGQGLGTLILTRMLDRLGSADVDDVIVGALPHNPVVGLYERYGFQPAFLYLGRLRHRRSR